MPPGCPKATVWINCCQSYIDSALHKRLRISDNTTLGKVVSREDEFRLLYVANVNSNRYRMPPLRPYPPFGVVKLKKTALKVRLHAFCGHRPNYSHWVWRDRNRPDLLNFGIPRSACPDSHEQRPSRKSIVITRICQFLLWLQRRLYASWHLLFGSLWPLGKALPCKKLSESATRNIFSWTLFSDGVRLDEMPVWGHEWLSILLDLESDDENASVTSSEEA